MVLKLAGILMIISASVAGGFLKSQQCTRRPHQLRSLQSMFLLFENEILYSANVLSDSFERICMYSKGAETIFFKKMLEILRHDHAIGAPAAWEMSVNESYLKTALNAEDVAVLQIFGKMLGMTDLDSQVKHARLVSVQLGAQALKADETVKKNASMYRNLGILCGLAAAIVLF
jgi:stage III sporulation protein AB